jgi:hypothetical protein
MRIDDLSTSYRCLSESGLLVSKGTLWIVLEHLSGENQRVMKELGSHSQLLFAYLKAIMDARSSSRPLSSIGSKPVVVASSSSHSVTFEEKDSSASEQLETGGIPSIFIQSQWEPDIHVGDLLQRSGMEFTDEMAELYVQVGLLRLGIVLFFDLKLLNVEGLQWRMKLFLQKGVASAYQLNGKCL